jgi:hypothetical protein
VTAGHELDVGYPDSPIVDATTAPAAGVVPGQRVPDAGPVVRADGTTTSLRELTRHAGLQVWVCVGTDPPDAALAATAPLAGAVAVKIIVIADRPPPPRGEVEFLADPALHVHGRLGALHDAMYVVRPDGYLGARIEPPDLRRMTDHLRQYGLTGR